MKNAIKFGLILGLVSGAWLLILHLSGVYERSYPVSDRMSWLEYVSIIIPFLCLYFGVRNFRNNENGGQLEFFEGIFESFKILFVGGIIAGFFGTVYMFYINTDAKIDYMGKIWGAGTVGILFAIVISLMLMNRQRNL